jgi:hypothetical protein
VFHSPTLRDALEATCLEIGIKPQSFIRPVATRWNSLAEVLQRALVLEEAINSLCDRHEFNNRTMRLRSFILSDDEKLVMAQLSPLLDVGLLAFVIPSHLRSPHLRIAVLPHNHEGGFYEQDPPYPSSDTLYRRNHGSSGYHGGRQDELSRCATRGPQCTKNRG